MSLMFYGLLVITGQMRTDGTAPGDYFSETRVPAPVTDPTKHLVDYSGKTQAT